MASHLPELAAPPPPELLPLATVGQPRAVHEQQRLLLGEQGMELLPEILLCRPLASISLQEKSDHLLTGCRITSHSRAEKSLGDES